MEAAAIRCETITRCNASASFRFSTARTIATIAAQTAITSSAASRSRLTRERSSAGGPGDPILAPTVPLRSDRVNLAAAPCALASPCAQGLTRDDLADFLELPLVAVLATYRRNGTVLL